MLSTLHMHCEVKIGCAIVCKETKGETLKRDSLANVVSIHRDFKFRALAQITQLGPSNSFLGFDWAPLFSFGPRSLPHLRGLLARN